jgi:hypothetical protein
MRNRSQPVTIRLTILQPRFPVVSTDYTAAIATLFGLVALLTGMTVFILTRPSDLAPLRNR